MNLENITMILNKSMFEKNKKKYIKNCEQNIGETDYWIDAKAKLTDLDYNDKKSIYASYTIYDKKQKKFGELTITIPVAKELKKTVLEYIEDDLK